MRMWLTTGLLSVSALPMIAAAQTPDIADIFRSALACRLAEPALADAPVSSVYQLTGQACEQISPDEDGEGLDADRLYADASCRVVIPFEATPLGSWCDTLLDSTGLGEGLGLPTDPARADWTLSPGSRLDLGARSLEGFFGLELTVPHFTQRGFTVFVPFYRLLDDAEGSAACNQADFETGVVADAHAAFDWVLDNASRYGVTGKPVLFGQSAGGHLAARISADRPNDVASAVLFYTPVDFTDFVQRAQTGEYTDEQGLDIIQRVVDEPLAQVDLSATPVPENSLPTRVVQDGVELPPMFMLHGDADVLVESRQSVRLCEAINGVELTPSDVEVPRINSTREVTLCGDRSSVHRVRQARHALDVCIAATFIATDLCLSGNETSRMAVADSIGSAAAFASGTVAEGGNVLFTDDEPPADQGPNGIGQAGGSGGGSGSGAMNLGMAFLLLCYAGIRRSARKRQLPQFLK